MKITRHEDVCLLSFDASTPVAGTWTYKHGSGMYKTFWTWDFVVGFTLISPKARAKIPNKTDAIP